MGVTDSLTGDGLAGAMVFMRSIRACHFANDVFVTQRAHYEDVEIAI